MSKPDVKDDPQPKKGILDNPIIPPKKPALKKIKQTNTRIINHVRNKNITLSQDVFGNYLYDNGKCQKIYRYTWKNHNKIEVEVITYGARIRSMKVPNKKGIPDDIVLGFKDLAGYIYYGSIPFGSVIGRVTNYVENSTFVIDGKQYWLSSNSGKHHYNGGFTGLDQVIFSPYVDGTKVIMSYTSPDLSEGYPGNLLIRITFELTTKNEFSINMEALTTKPTLVNLSNLMYFNLAGHQAGPDELYKHTVTINSNCYTMYDKNSFPTGDIQNVINTQFDFQIPTILKTCMGIKPDDGFDQNLCVNRGVEQGLCFVARALHVPSGRILEIYSNQYGVNFNTANNFGSGLLPDSLPAKPATPLPKPEEDGDNIFDLLDQIHTIMLQDSELVEGEDLEMIKDLIERISKCDFGGERVTSANVFNLDANFGPVDYKQSDYNAYHMMTALELGYLIAIKDIASHVISSPSRADLLQGVNQIIDLVRKFDQGSEDGEEDDDSLGREDVLRANHAMLEKYSNIFDDMDYFEEGEESKQVADVAAKDVSQAKKKTAPKNANVIPKIYKDGRMHGKNNAIYKRHGAMCFQTQNYPNAIYHPNFPNTILRPGETYRHTIVYKLFVQSGSPIKWIKRQKPC